MGKRKRTEYSLDEIFAFFKLKKIDKCKHLKEWQNISYELNDYERTTLENKHQLMRAEGDYWNEEELKIYFIAFVFDTAAINVASKVKVFFERQLAEVIKDKYFSVKCDCMIATPLGLNTPQKPYFFLQEFKKGKKNPDDPEAQMLTAMLIAQEKNKNDFPIYGSWVVGRSWFFAVLADKEYCVSKVYDTTQWKDLLQVVFMLRHLRDIVLRREAAEETLNLDKLN